MNKVRIVLFCTCVLLVGLQGCSNLAIQENQRFTLSNKQHLYALSAWSFHGRLAIKNQTESWSASIHWQHQRGRDILKLSGPLGQGAVLVTMTPAGIEIDRGDGQVEYSSNQDQLIAHRLGILVPVSALKYWVIGLVQPNVDFEAIDQGFNQAEWSVIYPLFMLVDSELMPHKMRVNKDGLQLKLVFDEWRINDV